MNSVNNPIHYQGCSPIGRELLSKHFRLTDEDLDLECIEFLESNHRYLDFHTGNAIKYLWRCGVKGDVEEDLRKCLTYLRRRRSPLLQNFYLLFLLVFAPSRHRNQIESQIDRLIYAIECRLLEQP